MSGFFNKSNIDLNVIEEYNDAIQVATDKQAVLKQYTEGTNKATADLIRSTNGAAVSQDQLSSAIQKTTIKARIGTAVMKAFSVASKMVVFAAISWGIGKVIEGIDNYIHRIDNAREAIADISSEIKEINDTFNNTSKAISEIAKRFAQLSQGVNQLTGVNKTLTVEEYEEFLSLNNQIAELFPSLPKIYNDNGDAIVQLSGDVDGIVGSLQHLVDVERDLANQELADKMPNLFNNLKTSLKDYNEDLTYLQNKRDAMTNVIESFNKDMLKAALNSEETFKIHGDNAAQIVELSKLYDYAFEALNMSLMRTSPSEFAVSSWDKYKVIDLLSSEDIDEEIERAFNYAVDKYGEEYNLSYDKIVSEITTINNSKNSEYNNFKQSLFAWLNTNSGSGYSMMTDTLQASIQTIIGSLDFNTLMKQYTTPEEFQSYILNSIIYPIRDNGDIQEAITSLFTTDFSKMSFKDANEMIDGLISSIAEVLNLNPLELKVSLGFGGYGDIKDRLENAINSISGGDSFLSGMLFNFIKDMNYSDAEFFLSFFDEAESVIDWINRYYEGLKKAHDETNKFFSEVQIEKLDKYQSKIKELGDSYSKLLSGNYSNSDILDILKTLSEQGVDMSHVDSIEGLEALIKHSSTAKDEVEALIKELEIKPDSDFANFLRELAYETVHVDSAFDGLSSRLNGIKNGYTTLKDAIEEYNSSGKLTVDTFDALMNTDYNNLFSILSGGEVSIDKEKVRKEILDYIANVRTVLNQESANHTGTDREASKTKTLLLNKFYEYVSGDDFSLDDIFGTGGDSASDFEQQIDWAEHSVSNLEREVSNLETALDNTKGYQAQAEAIQDVIDAQMRLKEGYENSAGVYNTEYEKVLTSGILASQGLSDEVRKKIEYGDLFDIQDFIAENVKSGEESTQQQIYDAIQKAIDWYNKSTDASDNAIKLGFEIEEKYKEKIDLVLDSINDKIDDINDSIDDNQELIDSQDRFISGAVAILNQEIEVQEGLRDAIQDQIDALQEENDEHERALALEKAKYELQRAQSQRTVKLYSGRDKGFIYTQDEQAVRDARESLDQLEFEETIHALGKQKEYYDDIINNLGEMQDRWNSIASKAQEMLDIEYALASIGGENARDAILNNTYDIDGFEQGYQSFVTKGEQLDNQKKGLEDLEKSISNVFKEFEDDTITYEECIKRIANIAPEYAGWFSTITNTVLADIKALEGESSNASDSVEKDTVDAAKDVTKTTGEETEEQITILSEFADTVKRTYSEVVSNIIKDMELQFQEFVKKLTTEAENLKKTISETLSGVENSVSEDGITVNISGSALGNTPNIEQKASGGMLTGKDKELDKLAHSLGEDHITLLGYKEGKRVLTPVQNEIWEKLSANASNLVMNPPNIGSIFTPKYDNIPESRVTNSTQVSIGDIHLHEVQNVPDFAKALQRHLPNISVQYNGKH